MKINFPNSRIVTTRCIASSITKNSNDAMPRVDCRPKHPNAMHHIV